MDCLEFSSLFSTSGYFYKMPFSISTFKVHWIRVGNTYIAPRRTSFYCDQKGQKCRKGDDDDQ